MKGFGRPVRVYRVVGIYDELEQDGRIIREENDGFRLLHRGRRRRDHCNYGKDTCQAEGLISISEGDIKAITPTRYFGIGGTDCWHCRLCPRRAIRGLIAEG